MSTFARPVLVLNKSWAPVQTVSLKRAIIMLFTTYKCGEPKARIIDPENDFQTFSWEDWSELKPKGEEVSIRGCGVDFRIPEVILLTRYNKVPKPKGQFSRRNLYKRDKLTCQYCGLQTSAGDLTIDHVLPRSQGGTTVWENVVLACVPCNSRKADKTPAQAKMKLAKEPKKPHITLLNHPVRIESWKQFLGQAYWNVELENDM